jgi:hypothetical protein
MSSNPYQELPEPKEYREDDEEDKETGMKSTKLTDPVCLLVFLLYVAGMIYCFVHGLKYGDIKKLTHGMDFTGELCGVGENVSDRPYLLWCKNPDALDSAITLNLDLPVCVKTCPTEKDLVRYCPHAGTPSKVYNYFDPTDHGRYEVTMTETFEVENQTQYPTRKMGDQFCWPDYKNDPSVQKALVDQIKKGPLGGPVAKMMEFAGDLQRGKWLLLGCFAIVLSLSFAYLFFLEKLAGPLVWTTLGLMILLPLLAAACCFASAYVDSFQEYSPLFKALTHEHAFLWSQILGGIFAVISLAFIVLALCSRESIDICIGCIEAACECMFDMPTMLIEPLCAALAKFFVFIILLWGFLWLVTTAKVARRDFSVGGKEVVGIGRTFVFTEEQRDMVMFYSFGILWAMAMCDAIQKYVISYAVVLWYYTPLPAGDRTDKRAPWIPLWRGLFNVFTFHLGSIAFGALLVAICNAIRIFLSVISKQVEAADNKAAVCVAHCFLCCASCFKKCIEYINKNAYIDIAIRSSDFIPAAMHSFHFIASEPAGIGILAAATNVARVGGVLSITSCSAWLAFVIVTKAPWYSDPSSESFIQQPMVIVAVAGFMGLIVSFLFMIVFDMASSTMIYVFCDNRKRNKSSVRKYATEKLMKVIKDAEKYN